MNEQAVDLRGTLGALRRQSVVIVSLLALGLGVGLGVSVAEGRTFAANARVLLPPSPGLDTEDRPVRNVQTEVHVARSAEILAEAAKSLRRPVDVAALRPRVRVRAATADLLEVRAEAGSAGEAAGLANAVARAYVAYANGVTSAQVESTVTELEKHSNELATEIGDIQKRIAGTNERLVQLSPGSPEAVSLGALISSLYADQLDAERRLYSVNTRIGEMRLNAQLSRGGTRLLEPATRPRQTRPRPLVNTAIGGSVGLLAGVVIALLRAQRSRKLHYVRDIADAVRAPVLASLETPPLGGAKRCRALLEQWEPGAVERLALHHAFEKLGLAFSTRPHNLTVVTLAGDRGAHLVALELAVFSATAGVPTAFVVASGDSSVADVRLACGDGGRAEPPRRNLWTYGVSDPTAIDLVDPALTVTLVSASEGSPVVPTGGRRTVVALAVSSGFATGETLAAAAAACLEAGHPVRGVFVANPERGDRTVAHPDMPSSLAFDEVTRRGGTPEVEAVSASTGGEQPAVQST